MADQAQERRFTSPEDTKFLQERLAQLQKQTGILRQQPNAPVGPPEPPSTRQQIAKAFTHAIPGGRSLRESGILDSDTALSTGAEIGTSMIAAPAMIQAASRLVTHPALRGALALAGSSLAVGAAASAAETLQALREGNFDMDDPAFAKRIQERGFEAAIFEVIGAALPAGASGIKRRAKSIAQKAVGKVTPEGEEVVGTARELVDKLKPSISTKGTQALNEMPLMIAERTEGSFVDVIANVTENALTGGRIRKTKALREQGAIDTINAINADFVGNGTPAEVGEYALSVIKGGRQTQQAMAQAFWRPLDDVGNQVFVNAPAARRFGKEEVRKLKGGGVLADDAASGLSIASGLASGGQAPASLRKHVKGVVLKKRPGLAADEEKLAKAVERELPNWMTLEGAMSRITQSRAKIVPTANVAKGAPQERIGVIGISKTERAVRKALKDTGREDLLGFYDNGIAVSRMRSETFNQKVVKDIIATGVEGVSRQPDAILDMVLRAGPDNVKHVRQAMLSNPGQSLRKMIKKLEADGIEVPPTMRASLDEALKAGRSQAGAGARAWNKVREGFNNEIYGNSLTASSSGVEDAALDAAKLAKQLDKHGRQKLETVLGKTQTENWMKLSKVLSAQQRVLAGESGRMLIQMKQAAAIGGVATGTYLAFTGDFGGAAAGAGAGAVGFLLIPGGLARVLSSPTWTNRFVQLSKAAATPGATTSRPFARQAARFVRFTQEELDRLESGKSSSSRRNAPTIIDADISG